MGFQFLLFLCLEKIIPPHRGPYPLNLIFPRNISVEQGGCVNVTVTIVLEEFSEFSHGEAYLFASISQSFFEIKPYGISWNFSRRKLLVNRCENASSILTIYVNSATRPGNYTIYVLCFLNASIPAESGTCFTDLTLNVCGNNAPTPIPPHELDVYVQVFPTAYTGLFASFLPNRTNTIYVIVRNMRSSLEEYVDVTVFIDGEVVLSNYTTLYPYTVDPIEIDMSLHVFKIKFKPSRERHFLRVVASSRFYPQCIVNKSLVISSINTFP
ncbi:MAG: hypothetical protein NDF54_09805 [archaeon GB-1867-035]|nr:hypothetical protein [Candidatus Culexmicrobium profundum]